jgi:dephospho-CoA kinase
MVLALIPRGRAFKLGVLREDQGMERFVLKERLVSEAEAVAKAREIRDCIRRGDQRFAGG